MYAALFFFFPSDKNLIESSEDPDSFFNSCFYAVALGFTKNDKNVLFLSKLLLLAGWKSF